MEHLINAESVIMSVKRLVESDRRSEIRMSANGGNSVLVVCPPDQEQEFMNAIHLLMTTDTYSIIDLNDILIRFIEESGDDMDEKFDLLRGSIGQVFKTPSGETGSDLFGMIINTVSSAFEAGKIPVLIRAGALYGSEIDNIHIMESRQVMSSGIPLIILYPATHDGDKLLFLGHRPSSKYRCMIVE